MRTLASRALACFVLALALLVAGCGEATSILVRVSSSELTPPADVDTLEFTIRGETTGHVENRTFAVTTGWPHSLSIRPGPTEANRVSVTVRARRAGIVVAEATRTESFVRGTDIILDVELGAGATPDAGPRDAGDLDARDVGANDAGADAPITDTGPDSPSDTGPSDGGPVDAGRGDAGCLRTSDCDDGVRCTVDDCVAGMCTNVPNDAFCEDGTTCDPMSGCPARSCTTAADCDDGLFCNGEETCLADMTCGMGSPPCDDAMECTDDACSETTEACTYTTRDRDGDGAGDAMCPSIGGVPATDCDDTRDDVVPGAPDVCDGLDNDCTGGCDSRSTCCRGTSDTCVTSCGTTGERTCGATCGWSICSPPAETCNGVDDDCNGACDDGFACCVGSTGSCTTSCGSTGSRVCNDTCAFGACTPPAETCNGRDDDCDGACDDGFGCCAGVPSPCTTVCGSAGTRSCSAGCVPAGACTPPVEVCNDRDEDCDTNIDESFSCRNGSIRTCTTTCGTSGTQTCASCEWGVCAPPAEVCFNGIDDDCDLMADEGCPTCGSCAGATTVTAPGGRYNVTTSGSTTSGTCGGGGGAEAFLTFTLTSTSDVFITTHQSLRDTMIYVRQCACSGPEVGCNDNADGQMSSALILSDLAPGTYNVVIDTAVPTSQTIAVDVFINAAAGPNDRCGEPFAIQRADTVNINGNTCGFLADYDNQVVAGPTACPYGNGGDGTDAVTYFVVPSTRTVTISGCTGTVHDQVLYVRNVCTDAALPAQVACSDDNCGAPTMMCDSTLAGSISQMFTPGIYYLFIDGYTEAGCGCGMFNLTITGL